MLKRIIACFCVLFNLFFLFPLSASATSISDAAGAVSILDWMEGDSNDVSWSKWWDALFSNKLEPDPGCPASEDGYHEWTWNNKFTGTLTGSLDVECKHCLLKYRNFLSEQYSKPPEDVTALDAFRDRYGKFNSALPATTYASDGTMLWYCTFDDLAFVSSINVIQWASGIGVNTFSWPSPFDDITKRKVRYSKGTDNRSIDVYLNQSSDISFSSPSILAYSFVVPVSGTYTLTDSPASSCTVVGSSCGTLTGGAVYSNTGQSWHIVEGDSISQSCEMVDPFTVGLSVHYISGKQLFPVYSVVPDVVPGEPSITEQYYDNSTRVGNYVGSYAVYNSDSGYSYVGGTSSVVNEDNSQVWNPVTNTTTDYSGWTYDYSTRTYTFSNDDNSNTSTVTYGDENITIADTAIDGNGNTVTNNYTVYYYNGTATDTPSPSPSPSPSDGPVVPGPSPSPSCRHDWTYTVVNEPTCLSAGSKTGACSLCGATKKETIPATGHTWVIKKSLATAYDDEGNLVQQGYTIYKCSICGEEYKDVDGVGPPGSSSEDEGGGFWAWVGDKLGGLLSAVLDLLGGLVGGLIDGLVSLLEMLLGKLGTVVEAILSVFAVLPSLFTGFLDLLSALFPFLPEEIMTVLTFGIIACVVIGIIRLIWR